ncbi:MAG: hypothetical protein M1153_00525 [Patescibacteria group bacterium]|nr:hypothetical protein [Patescibacteria group bacterium]
MKIKESKLGQTMLLTILVIASVLLMVAAISGLIMSYAIRQVTDAQSSVQAIFAADTGIECVLYYHFCNGGSGSSCPAVDCSNPTMDSGGTNVWNLTCGGAKPPTFASPPDNSLYSYNMQCVNSTASSQTWISVGQDARKTAARSLQITLTQIQ